MAGDGDVLSDRIKAAAASRAFVIGQRCHHGDLRLQNAGVLPRNERQRRNEDAEISENDEKKNRRQTGLSPI